MRCFGLSLLLAGLAGAQTVMPGLGGSYNSYISTYGPPTAAGDTLIDAQERIWKLKRAATFGDVKMELRVFFRAGKAVEERWVRVGKDAWSKDELWHILDGKAPDFKLVRRSEGTPSPYQAMDNANGLIYFVTSNREYGALLQRSALGPQIRISSRQWATTLNANGYGQVRRNRPVATLRSEAPRWGGLKEGDLQDFTLKLGRDRKASGRTWLLPGSAGEISWKTVSSCVAVTVRLHDPKLWKQWTTASVSRRTELKKEFFVHFGSLAYQYLPKLVGNLSWRTDRIEGSLPGWSPSGGVRLLDAKGSIGETWKLDLVPDGYLLQVDWPTGVIPGT
jgi:hypothetical protein